MTRPGRRSTVNLSVYVSKELETHLRREAARTGKSLSLTMIDLLTRGLWSVHNERKGAQKAKPAAPETDSDPVT